jgi:hypothetical protein
MQKLDSARKVAPKVSKLVSLFAVRFAQREFPDRTEGLTAKPYELRENRKNSDSA